MDASVWIAIASIVTAGLTITIGAILTLALLMLLTARVNWVEKLGGFTGSPPQSPPAPPLPPKLNPNPTV